MALNGEGEPYPTLMQKATQAATIELFTQWMTYRNGVHMDWDTFRSVDFHAIAVAVLTAAGFEVTAVEATLSLPELDDELREVPADMPKLRKLLAQPSPFAQASDEDPLGRTVTDGKVPSRPYGLSPAAIAEHGKQVNG